jgi:hypothetical protein
MLKRLNRILLVSIVSLFMVCGSATVSSAHTTPTHHVAVAWFQPLLTLPRTWLPAVDCLLHKESRSTRAHPNLGDNRTPSMGTNSGIFQMNNAPGGVWDSYAMPTLHVQIWKATPYQQAQGFVDVLRLDGGFHPWHGDGCIYPN